MMHGFEGRRSITCGNLIASAVMICGSSIILYCRMDGEAIHNREDSGLTLLTEREAGS